MQQRKEILTALGEINSDPPIGLLIRTRKARYIQGLLRIMPPTKLKVMQGFGQELKHDICLLCTDGFTNTTFARSLCHADKHDIHNADILHQPSSEMMAAACRRLVIVVVLCSAACAISTWERI